MQCLPARNSLDFPIGQYYHECMTRRQGFRFRLTPKSSKEILLRKTLGCARFVWNALLAENKALLDAKLKRMGYAAMCKRILELKTEFPFLAEVHSQPLQQTAKDLDGAINDAFNPEINREFPVFKKKGRACGIRFPQGVKINASAVYLPKIGWCGFRKSREVLGNVKNVSVRSDSFGWSLSLQTEREVADAVHPSESVVGIDLGIQRFAALSDGTFVDGPNALKKSQDRLALLQRQVSRKVKFSKNWCKAKAKVARLHHRIANIRKDALHKASTTISKNHAVVVLEDLRVANMSKSVAGTMEAPGKNVAAKSGLNRRILDQGWFEFRRQLEYKLAWRGGSLIIVDPKNTSRTCSSCGHVARENRQTQEAFVCIGCGHAANADTNAAINILGRAGHARIACAEHAPQEARRVA